MSFGSLAVDPDLYGQCCHPLEILPGLGAGQSLPIQVVGLLVCPQGQSRVSAGLC